MDNRLKKVFCAGDFFRGTGQFAQEFNKKEFGGVTLTFSFGGGRMDPMILAEHMIEDADAILFPYFCDSDLAFLDADGWFLQLATKTGKKCPMFLVRVVDSKAKSIPEEPEGVIKKRTQLCDDFGMKLLTFDWNSKHSMQQLADALGDALNVPVKKKYKDTGRSEKTELPKAFGAISRLRTLFAF